MNNSSEIKQLAAQRRNFFDASIALFGAGIITTRYGMMYEDFKLSVAGVLGLGSGLICLAGAVAADDLTTRAEHARDQQADLAKCTGLWIDELV